ncbi:uncharacterized protein LOC129615206 [Condylostylus longicornis]|uniref:uncharacterized protein LOC129615206 n=1 Tax=Condylostylus longicornis TaxID=2530218 RepID=UPI00244E4C8E|nr:uncharacterized protein LOC129615206 [Condylostylus longicornis]
MEKVKKNVARRKKCIVPKCCSHLKKQKDVSLHIFPKNEEIKRKWIALISTEDFIPNVLPNSTICSEHFDSNFKQKLPGKIYLTPDALPNFDSQYLDKEISENESVSLNANELVNEEEYDNTPSISNHFVSAIQKINETPSTTNTLQAETNAVKNIRKQFKKQKLEANESKTICKKKIKNLKVIQQTSRKYKKRVESFYKLLTELEEKKLITPDVNKIISSSLQKIIDSL